MNFGEVQPHAHQTAQAISHKNYEAEVDRAGLSCSISGGSSLVLARLHLQRCSLRAKQNKYYVYQNLSMYIKIKISLSLSIKITIKVKAQLEQE